jgi:hypothetical protein
MSSLVVWVVDFDAQVAPYQGVTPMVGPQIVQATEQLNAPSGSLGWLARSPADFNYDPMEVRSQINDFKLGQLLSSMQMLRCCSRMLLRM